jgi:hypothetical protein
MSPGIVRACLLSGNETLLSQMLLNPIYQRSNRPWKKKADSYRENFYAKRKKAVRNPSRRHGQG